MTVALKRNVPGYVDELGRFRPIRSASYIGSKSAPRKAKASDRRKYSKAKAGDLGKARQERALEAPWDREFRLEQEAAAAKKREQDRITRELEREIYGETSGRTSRGKARSLAQFVRAEGGINTKKTVRKGRVRYGDSLENFTRKGSGSTGLVTTTPGKGKSLDYMHQAAREAGYDVESMDDLLDALDNEIRSGKKMYSTHGSMTYNPAKKAKKNPDLLGMFANAAVGIASTLQINEMVKSRKRKAAPKKRGTTKAKATVRRSNPTQPKVKAKGDLYVLTIGSGDDLISVYLHDGDKDGFSKRFKTLTAAKAYATRNKIKLVDNPAAKKVNGVISRAWARSRAKAEYGKELRLSAALERSRSRRHKAEAKSKANPAARRGALAKLPAGAEIEWNGRLFLVRVPSVSRQFIGSGKTKTEAVNAALAAIKRQKNPKASGKKAAARSAKANPAGAVPRGCSVRKVGDKWRVERTSTKRLIAAGASRLAAITAARKKLADFKGWLLWGDKAPARKNPRSMARRRTFEMFQGRKVTTARPMIVSNHAPAKLDQLGDLIELKISGMARPIRFNGKTAKLCAANGKLWIAGKRFAKPNPKAAANEINPIGEIDHVVYGTRKPHHGDHDYTHYIHKLGEESGRRPILCVDREGFPVIRGGNYKIEARGIVD